MKKNNHFEELFYSSLNKFQKILRNAIFLLIIGGLQAYAFETNSGIVVSEEQQVRISGTITDSKTGEALPGVNIVVKGTNIGIISDISGRYAFDAPAGGTLVFSFIGYDAQEIPIAGRTTINIAMVSALSQLSEVVVTGYASQSKVSVIGSISTVNTQELKSVPAPTLAASLMGRTTGVYIKQKSAQPGDYFMSYSIRGYGDALIIIDGLAASSTEFLLLDPNDIEQINILKDAATAAVYGARAGNGVILVKTRRGALGAPKFNYSFNYGAAQITMLPGQVNSAQNAQFENIAHENADFTPTWTQDDINKFNAGNDPAYPNTNWWDETLRKNAPQMQHNLTVTGGTDKVKYFISGGYFYQESHYRSNDLKNKKYNLRSNLDVALSDKLDIGVDFSILENDYIGPTWNMKGDSHWGIMCMLYRSRPQYPAYFEDRTKSPGMGGDDPNPRDPTYIDKVGYYQWAALTSDLKFNFAYELPWGFGLKGLFNYKQYNKDEKTKEKDGPVYYTRDDGSGGTEYVQYLTYNLYNKLRQENNRSYAFNQQYFLTWNRRFGNHKIDALGVFEHLSSEGSWNMSERIRYKFDMDYLFAGPDKDKTNDGNGWQDGRISQIFSFNYGYKEKYLFGFSARRDGSPKFSENQRYGVFPSVSAGWRISEENFLKSNQLLSNLKLRASWGKLGYDATGNYQYLSTYSIRPASFMQNGVVESAIRGDRVPNPNITWEKITTSNIGVDFGLFSGKLTGAFDAFYRYRSDVLGTVQVALPDVVGAIMPQENIEEYSNRGFEFELNYHGKVGDVEYNIGGNYSFSRERIEYISQPTYATEEVRRRSNRIGLWADSQWGYLTDGVFLTQEEIDNWAIMDGKNNARLKPGDVRFIDYNEDGIVDANDQVVIGRGYSPDIMFALTGGASWKGFELNMLWQGAGGFDLKYGSADLGIPFAGGNAPLLEMYKYSYTPENEWGVPANIERYPLYPRYYWEGYSTSNTNFRTDFWLRPGNYLRLKTLELAYNLPKQWLNKVSMSNLKVYFSGYNLLTFSKLDFLDPEFQSQNLGDWGFALAYPPTKTYSFGLVAEF